MAMEVEALPDDALANVFRGLPLRSLAVIRCVCKAWRDVVDAHALLLPHLHLLPRTVRGVFINYGDHNHPHHFSRPCSPATTPRVDGTLSFLPKDADYDRRRGSVLDHCNGLLLCSEISERSGFSFSKLCVCNPATGRWTVLPRWWRSDDHERHHRYAGAYIAFDPAESPQYEVILAPAVPKVPSPKDPCWSAAEVQRRREKEKDAPFCLDWFFSLPEDGTSVGQWEIPSNLLHLQHDIDDPCRYMEWPPAAWTLRVFSSRTGQWEDRAFVREGFPAGTVHKMRWDRELPYRSRWRYAVYHHGSLYVHCRGSFVPRYGSLYVHCHGSFVTRLSFSNSKYQIIETPTNVDESTKPYLGKLHNGVCFGIIHYHQLKIWILNDSSGQMEWALKYETMVGHFAKYLASITFDGRRPKDGSWTIEENIEIQDTDHDVESLSEEENDEIGDTDHDVESLSEEENIEIQDTDHDVESLLEEENVEIEDTGHDVESLSEKENIEIQDTDHDVESLAEEANIEIWDADHDVDSLSDEGNIEIQDTNHDVESPSKEGYEWDSDNDDTLTINAESQEHFDDRHDLNIMGFHPYKEVVFMVQQYDVVSYHLSSSKIQYLGDSWPKYCSHNFWNHIYESFLYTPCMIGDLIYGDQTGGASLSKD